MDDSVFLQLIQYRLMRRFGLPLPLEWNTSNVAISVRASSDF